MHVLTNSEHSAAMAHRYFVVAPSFSRVFLICFFGLFENPSVTLIMIQNCLSVAADSRNT
jgi:hypothetical protein